MTEDLTNKLNPNIGDEVALILTAVNDLIFRVGMSERKSDDFAEKLERRLQNLSSDVAQLQEGQRRLEEGQQRLEAGQKGLQGGQKRLRSDLTALRRHVDHQFMKLSGEVEKRYREHHQRITRLETNTNPANSQ